MQSLVSLYNTALARLGGNQFDRVNTPDEDSATASLCRTLFPHVLDMALAHSPWQFAREVVALGQKPNPEPSALVDHRYPFRFELPRDCVRPIQLQPETEFVISGQDLLTRVNPAILGYTARLDQPPAWPPNFADGLAWLLASELATAHINDPQRQQFYLTMARAALDNAAAVERNSQRPINNRSPWIGAR